MPRSALRALRGRKVVAGDSVVDGAATVGNALLRYAYCSHGDLVAAPLAER